MTTELMTTTNPTWCCGFVFADGTTAERIVTVPDPAQALDIAECSLGAALASQIVAGYVEAA